MQELLKISKNFSINDEIKEISPITTGLINSTYLVKTLGNTDYILQKKNKSIFPNVPAMMDNIVKVTDHIRKKVVEAGGNPETEVMTVVKAQNGEPYVTDDAGDFWTMSVFIPDTRSYDYAENLELCRKGGEGIGKFQKQLEDFTTPLYPTIEGFHDMKFRFKQWDETLKTGLKDRIAEVGPEIEWIEKRRPVIENFWNLVETGKLPKRVTHNDTKLSNILFDKDDNVLCVIDLDTVMSNTPFADFGDAIRTFANTSTEEEKDLEKVNLDLEKFEAYTEGYLSMAKDMLNETETEYLAFSPQYIIYEQAMRFLMDYINGDTYYKTFYPGQNLVRTRSQMKLMESLEENYDKMKKIVDEKLSK